MTAHDLDNGRLIGHIGIAPVKPAEFVIVRISHFWLMRLAQSSGPGVQRRGH